MTKLNYLSTGLYTVGQKNTSWVSLEKNRFVSNEFFYANGFKRKRTSSQNIFEIYLKDRIYSGKLIIYNH